MNLTLKKWLLRNKSYLLGTLAGALTGFLYWRLIGCSSGSCAITSSPINSTLYFALVGLLTGGTFKRKKVTNGEQEAQT